MHWFPKVFIYFNFLHLFDFYYSRSLNSIQSNGRATIQVLFEHIFEYIKKTLTLKFKKKVIRELFLLFLSNIIYTLKINIKDEHYKKNTKS